MESRDVPRSLLDFAARICDGDDIDWATLNPHSNDLEPGAVTHLRELDAIARSNRRLQRDDGFDPEAIEGFCLLRRLGSGGVGEVFEAEQEHPRRAVALKVIRSDRVTDDRTIAWFRREAQTLARLQHPSIATLYSSDCTSGGVHYMAMELVGGTSLHDWIDRRGPATAADLDERLDIFEEIATAIAYAHRRGVIHRDLKPANVHVSGGPHDSTRVKVLDFGIAHAAYTTVLTHRGHLQGTLRSMSPEQIRGESDRTDTRTDVFALGLLLYELLAARGPFDLEGRPLSEQIRRVCKEEPRPLAEICAGVVPRWAEESIAKALAKDPDERHASVDVWLAEFAVSRSRRGSTTGLARLMDIARSAWRDR